MIEAVRAAQKLQKFHPLEGAIETRQQPQKLLEEVKPETRNSILSALQAAVYGEGFRERDRLTRQ